MKIRKTTNYIYTAHQPYYSVDGFMCSVSEHIKYYMLDRALNIKDLVLRLNFGYRSVCGINTLPSLAKLA